MYNYQTQRPFVFTEEGQVKFLAIRDHVRYLLKTAGAARMQEILCGARGGGSDWDGLACVDRLVELGELRELTPAGTVQGQYRVFVENR